MTTPHATKSQPTRIAFSDGLVKLLIAIFLVPAPFEIITGLVKKEQYDFERLGVVLVALTVLAVTIGLLRNRRVVVQSILGYYLVLAGLVIAAFGIAVTFDATAILGATTLAPPIETAISALAPSLGLLLVASGAYLIREQARRTREDMDAPGPPGIASPRTIKLNNDNASLWRSDYARDHPSSDGIIELCKAHLSIADLHFVAFYTADGECLFYLDFLDDDSMAPYNVRNTPERRRLYEQHGRHIKAMTTKLDKRFRSLDSGLLVRVVLDVEKGALLFYNLHREGFLLGATLNQAEVDPTDRKLSKLANEILTYRGGRPDDDFYRK